MATRDWSSYDAWMERIAHVGTGDVERLTPVPWWVDVETGLVTKADWRRQQRINAVVDRVVIEFDAEVRRGEHQGLMRDKRARIERALHAQGFSE